MQAAYAMTRLILFGFGWSVASILGLAADALLPGAKWPIFGILAASWTFICALYVAGEANRIVRPVQRYLCTREKSGQRRVQDH